MALVEINWQPTRTDLRVFGFGLTVFCLVIAWFFDPGEGRLALSASALFAAAVLLMAVFAASLALFAPERLRPVYFIFIVAAFPIGWVLSHVLLAIVYYGVFTPIGLVMRWRGRDPMQRRFDSKSESYWVPRDSEKSAQDYFRQF